MRHEGSQRVKSEVELLLSCARKETLDTPDDSSAILPSEDLDWEVVRNLSRRHRLQPFVYRSLPVDGISIPPDVRADLERASEALVRRNLHMTSELVGLLDRLKEEGIRVLTYKGPSLAELAYSDITLRKFVDLDLFVPEEEFDKAVGVLRADNYLIKESFPTFGEKTLQEQDTGIPIDLHFRITPIRYPFTFPFEKLWERRIEVTLSGEAVPTFNPSDLLPVLAVHGTRHFWVQLEWLVSFAALTESQSIDWTRVLRYSKRIGCDRMLLLGLQLSRTLLELPLPEKVSSIVDEERIVRWLSRWVVSRVVYRDPNYSQDNRRIHREKYLAQLALMRGLRARGKYAIRMGDSLINNKLNSGPFISS